MSAANRACAIAALLLPPATFALACAVAVETFPSGLAAVGGAALALLASGYAVVRRGRARALGLALAVSALAVSLLLLTSGEDRAAESIGIVGGVALSVAASGAAFRIRASLPEVASAPVKPVLIFNPKSGGGKAESNDLAGEAGRRGIEAIELGPGDDLEALARDAVDGGADALAMAGGDGSQAIVASVAAELGLPFACIPSGTRNHFALDLGVDRTDVVGALDALGPEAGERRVDLAEVNGKVFVNNVSLGLYAEAVQREGYREAKVKTILDVSPEIGPGGEGFRMEWTGPAGETTSSGAAVLISNNPYRLEGAVAFATRPRMDSGRIGVVVLGAPPKGKAGRTPGRPWEQWSAREFEVRADGAVPAGIDGEAVKLAAPLRFRSRPRALRVLIAPGHPGTSPSAHMPTGMLEGARALAAIAAGRTPEPPTS